MIAKLEKIVQQAGKSVQLIFTTTDRQMLNMSLMDIAMLQAKPCDLYFEMRLTPDEEDDHERAMQRQLPGTDPLQPTPEEGAARAEAVAENLAKISDEPKEGYGAVYGSPSTGDELEFTLRVVRNEEEEEGYPVFQIHEFPVKGGNSEKSHGTGNHSTVEDAQAELDQIAAVYALPLLHYRELPNVEPDLPELCPTCVKNSPDCEHKGPTPGEVTGCSEYEPAGSDDDVVSVTPEGEAVAAEDDVITATEENTRPLSLRVGPGHQVARKTKLTNVGTVMDIQEDSEKPFGIKWPDSIFDKLDYVTAAALDEFYTDELPAVDESAAQAPADQDYVPPAEEAPLPEPPPAESTGSDPFEDVPDHPQKPAPEETGTLSERAKRVIADGGDFYIKHPSAPTVYKVTAISAKDDVELVNVTTGQVANTKCGMLNKMYVRAEAPATAVATNA